MFKEQLDKIKGSKMNEDVLIRWHHRLMSEYGWIPLEEFKELPISTVINLLTEISNDTESMNRKIKKMK